MHTTLLVMAAGLGALIPAVVMIGRNGPYLAVRRETYEDLLLCDQ